MLRKGKKQPNLSEEVFNSINNPFYNFGGISSDFDSLLISYLII